MSDPWFKFYASDWLGGTSGLTAAERGVYITILALIYENGGPITMDRSRLARRCGVPSGSFKRILTALIDEKKLVETPEGLTNERAEEVMHDRQKVITKLQSGARKTNAIKRQKSQQKQQAGERSATRSASRNTRSQIPEEDTSVSSKGDFEDFWQVVPRRVGKGQARTAFARAVKKVSPERLISAMAEYARRREGHDPQYTAHPSTWLNGERWNDEPDQPFLKPVQGGKSHGSNLLEGFRIAAERRMAGREDRDPSQPLLPARAGGGFDGSGGD